MRSLLYLSVLAAFCNAMAITPSPDLVDKFKTAFENAGSSHQEMLNNVKTAFEKAGSNPREMFNNVKTTFEQNKDKLFALPQIQPRAQVDPIYQPQVMPISEVVQPPTDSSANEVFTQIKNKFDNANPSGIFGDDVTSKIGQFKDTLSKVADVMSKAGDKTRGQIEKEILQVLPQKQREAAKAMAPEIEKQQQQFIQEIQDLLTRLPDVAQQYVTAMQDKNAVLNDIFAQIKSISTKYPTESKAIKAIVDVLLKEKLGGGLLEAAKTMQSLNALGSGGGVVGARAQSISPDKSGSDLNPFAIQVDEPHPQDNTGAEAVPQTKTKKQKKGGKKNKDKAPGYETTPPF